MSIFGIKENDVTVTDKYSQEKVIWYAFYACFVRKSFYLPISPGSSEKRKVGVSIKKVESRTHLSCNIYFLSCHDLEKAQ